MSASDPEDPSTGPDAVGEQAPGGLGRPLDTTLARQELGYTPQWPLDRAIADYAGELRVTPPG